MAEAAVGMALAFKPAGKALGVFGPPERPLAVYGPPERLLVAYGAPGESRPNAHGANGKTAQF